MELNLNMRPWYQGYMFLYFNSIHHIPTTIPCIPTPIPCIPILISRIPTQFPNIPTQIPLISTQISSIPTPHSPTSPAFASLHSHSGFYR